MVDNFGVYAKLERQKSYQLFLFLKLLLLMSIDVLF